MQCFNLSSLKSRAFSASFSLFLYGVAALRQNNQRSLIHHSHRGELTINPSMVYSSDSWGYPLLPPFKPFPQQETTTTASLSFHMCSHLHLHNWCILNILLSTTVQQRFTSFSWHGFKYPQSTLTTGLFCLFVSFFIISHIFWGSRVSEWATHLLLSWLSGEKQSSHQALWLHSIKESLGCSKPDQDASKQAEQQPTASTVCDEGFKVDWTLFGGTSSCFSLLLKQQSAEETFLFSVSTTKSLTVTWTVLALYEWTPF